MLVNVELRSTRRSLRREARSVHNPKDDLELRSVGAAIAASLGYKPAGLILIVRDGDREVARLTL